MAANIDNKENVAKKFNLSKFTFVTLGVLILVFLVFAGSYFFNKNSNISNNSSINDLNKVVPSIVFEKNLSWCQPAANITKENFPKSGQSLIVDVVGGELVKGEILCRVSISGSKQRYYFNENMSKIYSYEAGQPRKNMTLLN